MPEDCVEVSGRVLQADGQQVRVQTEARLSCQACAEGRGCGGGVLGRLLERRREPLVFTAPTFACAPGQTVWIRMARADLQRIAIWIWGLPALAIVACALLLEALPGLWGWLGSGALIGAALIGPPRIAHRLAAAGLSLHQDATRADAPPPGCRVPRPVA